MRGQQDPELFFNTNAFVLQPVGTLGNVGRNTLIGPGIMNWDFSTLKDFRIREGQTLVFRFELFNVTNSLRPGNPGTNVGAPSTLGIVSSDATPPPGVTSPAS